MSDIEEIRMILGGTNGDVRTLGLLELIHGGLWNKETEYKLNRVLDLFEAECDNDPYTKALFGAYTALMSELLIHFGGEDAAELAVKLEETFDASGIVGVYEVRKRQIK